VKAASPTNDLESVTGVRSHIEGAASRILKLFQQEST
jgi:hypothetical protein